VSIQADITTALVASLDAVTWTATADPVTVETKNFPQYGIEDLANPIICITDGSIESERIARSAHMRDFAVEVYLARHTPEEADCDVMLNLLEELLGKLEDHSWPGVTWPTGVTSPQTIVVEKNPGEALTERNVWRAGIVVTFRVPRSH
jgi:hypothetical protein